MCVHLAALQVLLSALTLGDLLASVPAGSAGHQWLLQVYNSSSLAGIDTFSIPAVAVTCAPMYELTQQALAAGAEDSNADLQDMQHLQDEVRVMLELCDEAIMQELLQELDALQEHEDLKQAAKQLADKIVQAGGS